MFDVCLSLYLLLNCDNFFLFKTSCIPYVCFTLHVNSEFSINHSLKIFIYPCFMGFCIDGGCCICILLRFLLGLPGLSLAPERDFWCLNNRRRPRSSHHNESKAENRKQTKIRYRNQT